MKFQKILLLLSAFFLLPAFTAQVLAAEEVEAEDVPVFLVFNGFATVLMSESGEVLAVVVGNPYSLAPNRIYQSTATVSASSLTLRSPTLSDMTGSPQLAAQLRSTAASITSIELIPPTARSSVTILQTRRGSSLLPPVIITENHADFQPISPN
ncbi:MAG: hypothetical protein LR015_15800 [Verrucomicrobia bacterium]|nr:hypothetical protein [Verrucomicrobiota bacterium]